MPYVKPVSRGVHATALAHFRGRVENAGELNYIVSKVADEFLGDEPNYERFNAAIGALECAKLELYRRRVAPYEDTKIEENGDIR